MLFCKPGLSTEKHKHDREYGISITVIDMIFKSDFDIHFTWARKFGHIFYIIQVVQVMFLLIRNIIIIWVMLDLYFVSWINVSLSRHHLKTLVPEADITCMIM